MDFDHLLELYTGHGLWRLESLELRDAVRLLTGINRPYDESSAAMWEAEEHMEVGLRRLYYRELLRPAYRFDDNNGGCLGADAYEWTVVHPKAEERARAFVATHAIAKLAELYDDGQLGENRWLLTLDDDFGVEAAENGCDREPDFDREAWTEKKFEELFAPLREGYRP